MKKSAFIQTLIVAAIFLTGFAAELHARNDVSNIRCSGVIAEIGDEQFEFQQKCGPPTATEENGQVWIYDRRPEGSVYYVTFADGRVERIQVE